jgi:hypothetical protein
MKNINLAGPYFFHSVYENFIKSKPRVVLSNHQVLYDSLDTEEYNFFDFYQQNFAGHYFDNLKKPHIVLTGAFTMPYLENLLYDEKTVLELNSQGLEIYLYEILHFDFGRKKTCLIDLFDKTPGDLTYNDLKLHFVLNDDNLKDLYSLELESISKFVKSNNLTKVTVFTNENLTEEILQSKYKLFKIKTLDILCKGWRSNINKDIQLDSQTITNHFWSGNWRYDSHRHLIAGFLVNEDTNLSFIHKKSINDLLPKLWFDFSAWEETNPIFYKKILTGLDNLYNKSPLSFDQLPMCPSRKTVPACPSGFPLPVDSYIKSFCCILTESKFAYPFPCFSEKVTNAMLCGRPFILAAPPKTLKYLQSLGFKTFSNWWDESYDDETNHEKRLIKIFDLVEHISKLTLNECQTIYKEMIPVLEYNIKQLEIIKD